MAVGISDNAAIVGIFQFAVVRADQSADVISVMGDDLRHIEAVVQSSAVDTDESTYIACGVCHDLSLRNAEVMNECFSTCLGNQSCCRGKGVEDIQVVDNVVVAVQFAAKRHSG